MNLEFPDVQAEFRKSTGNRDQIANIHWTIKKARKFQKMTTSASLSMLKPFMVWITTNWKILKEMEIPYLEMPPYLSPEKPVCRSRSNS